MGEGEGGAGVQHPVATAGQVLRVEAGEGEESRLNWSPTLLLMQILKLPPNTEVTNFTVDLEHQTVVDTVHLTVEDPGQRRAQAPALCYPAWTWGRQVKGMT